MGNLRVERVASHRGDKEGLHSEKEAVVVVEGCHSRSEN